MTGVCGLMKRIMRSLYLKCLGKRNCERGANWKLQGNKKDYSFELIDADCGDLLPTDKNALSHKF